MASRQSFTDLGGVLPEAANAPADFSVWLMAGDKVRIQMPSMEKFHMKEGVVVEDMGQTKNGPRVAVHLNDMDAGSDVAFPPGVLARVPPTKEEMLKAHLEAEEKAKQAAAKPALHMRGSFTELGGVMPEGSTGMEVSWVMPGDRVRAQVPSLEKFHGKEGVVVENLGQTKNGPRVAVRLDEAWNDNGDKEVAFPPGVLARVKVAPAG